MGCNPAEIFHPTDCRAPRLDFGVSPYLEYPIAPGPMLRYPRPRIERTSRQSAPGRRDRTNPPGPTTRSNATPPPANNNIMKNYRARQSTGSFAATSPLDDGQESDDDFLGDGRGGLPRGWQELLTDTHGARLYRIAPSNGDDVEWLAEITVHGEVQRRRCPSELRARVWLAVWDKPRIPLNIF